MADEGEGVGEGEDEGEGEGEGKGARTRARARAGTMRRGHRVSVAKERPDRNVGGEGRLRGRDGGACSECYVNNFHPRGCNRPYERGKGREKEGKREEKESPNGGGRERRRWRRLGRLGGQQRPSFVARRR